MNKQIRQFYDIATGYRFNKAYIDDTANKYLFNIFSYCQNEMLKANGGIDPMRLDYHKMVHSLLEVKKLTADSELVRVGDEFDGGYTMARTAWGFSRSKVAYSLGICKDVSWDLYMAKCGYDIYQYDHTIKKLPKNNAKFHWKRIGIASGEETRRLKKIDNLIRMNGHENIEGMLLKSDIEGAEWGMLDGMAEDILKKFDQIVIELHDFILCDWKQKKRIVKVLKKLEKTFVPVHLHANNNNPLEYCDCYTTPNLLEITFVKRELFQTEDENGFWPKEMDRQNRTDLQDIYLGKWNVL